MQNVFGLSGALLRDIFASAGHATPPAVVLQRERTADECRADHRGAFQIIHYRWEMDNAILRNGIEILAGADEWGAKEQVLRQ
jgi:hypothetical protein